MVHGLTDVGSWLTGVGAGVEGWVGAGIESNGVDGGQCNNAYN